jgi:exonuclease SbcD
MRLVHLADTHLGFRQFDRLTSIGVNQREADVEGTFNTVVTKIIALAPDLVIIGGDVFHVVRPSNHAVVNAFQEFQRLVQSLPCSRIVLVAGNHDTPRSTETGGILGLLASLGIHVIDRTIARISFDDLGVSVLGVPDTPWVRKEFAEMKAKELRLGDMLDANAARNVMIMHGEVEGMLTGAAALHRDASEIPTADLNPPAWDYIGLGHWHVHRALAPNMYYSGSIDYTSSNPWGEMKEERERGVPGKGIVERDLVTGEHTFHPLPRSRDYVDVPTFSALGMTSEEINSAIRDALDAVPGGIEGKIVRLVVTECPRQASAALDQKALKSYRLRALNFHLDVRRPDVTRVIVSGGIARQHTLAERIGEFLRDRVDVPGVDKTDLVEMAGHYLAQTTDRFGNDDFALAKMLEASIAATAAGALSPPEPAAPTAPPDATQEAA